MYLNRILHLISQCICLYKSTKSSFITLKDLKQYKFKSKIIANARKKDDKSTLFNLMIVKNKLLLKVSDCNVSLVDNFTTRYLVQFNTKLKIPW